MRRSSLDTIDVGIDRELSSQFDAVKLVAGSIDDVERVSSAIEDGSLEAANSIAGSIQAIGANIVEVTAVGANIDDVITVAGDLTNVDIVATNIDNVNAVGPIAANVNAVANEIAAVVAVANVDNMDNIKRVADDLNAIDDNMRADITVVAGDLGLGVDSNVVTVGQNIEDVGIVANDIAKVVVVSENIEDVRAVVGSIDAVEINAANIVDIQNAEENAASALSSANIASTKAGEANASAATSSTQAGIATTKASEASSSAASALVSKNAASVSASNALISANNADISEANALASANSASNSASVSTTKASESSGSALSAGSSAADALVSKNSASTSAAIASTKAAEAVISANSATGNASVATTKANEASLSATSALASENKAEKWATEDKDVEVETGKYSAKHWAMKAQEFAEGSAENIKYDNTDSGLIATNVQDAIDEIDADLDSLVSNVYTKAEVQDTLPAVGLDTTNTIAPVRPGQIKWNQNEGTADLALNNGVTLQVGQENTRLVRNGTLSTIPNMTVCMFDGTIGNSGRIKIAPFTGLFDQAHYIYGIATQSINAGEDGYITIDGKVRNVNTTGASVNEVWEDGDILYAKPNNAGRLTKVIPADDELRMPIASVVHAHTNGTLEVRVLAFNENMIAKRANKWTTARTITLDGDVAGSASIDGSADVIITTTVQPNSVNLGTDTTGNYMVNVAAGSGISVSHTQGEGSTATITNSAPNVTTNITTTHTSTNVVVNSSDGTDGTINSATQTLAGVLSAVDKTKLDGIATNANNYIKPASEPISYITNLQATLDGKATNTALNVEKSRIDAILASAGANTDTFAEIVALINSVDTENDTAFSGYVLSNNNRSTAIENTLINKVDIVAGKGLSTEDYTTTEKSKLAGLSNYTKPASEPISYITGLQTALDSKVSKTGVEALHSTDALRINGKTLSLYKGDGTFESVVTQDTVYTLPTATSTVKGGIELFSDTVQSVASNAVSATSNRTYGIQLNSSGQAVVNVPWSDTNTNTTYTAGSGLSLTGSVFANTAPNVSTNLSTSTSSTTLTVNSSDGTNAILPAATTTVAGVMTSVDKAKLDGIEAGATGDQTATEILALIKTVDGAGSGLDADLLDGYSTSSSAAANTIVLRNGHGDISIGSLLLSNEIQVPTNSSLTDVTITCDTDQDTGFNFDNANGVNYVSGGVLKYNLNNVSLNGHTHDYVTEGGTTFSGKYPLVVRTAANVIYSDVDIQFEGSTSELSVGGSVATPVLKLGASQEAKIEYNSTDKSIDFIIN